MALAKIVRGGGGSGLEASTVLTVVVGTRTGLRIQHSCRGCSLAVPPREVRRALTLVIVYAVDASSTVLQRGRTKLQIKKGRERKSLCDTSRNKYVVACYFAQHSLVESQID